MSKVLNTATHTEVIPLATRTATLTGAAINITDFFGDLALTLMSAIGSTADTLDCKVQDSADGSTGWADVTAATWTQVTDAADAHEAILIKSNSIKQFIRVIGTIVGTSPSFSFAVTLVGFKETR